MTTTTIIIIIIVIIVVIIIPIISWPEGECARVENTGEG